MTIRMVKPLYVDNVEIKGRGVFCSKDIKEGDLIEEAPIISNIPFEVYEQLKGLILYNYLYEVDKDPRGKDVMALALGFASLYNHSYDPNSIYVSEPSANILRIFARRDIPANTELTINYNGDPTDQKKLWFDPI